MTVINYTEARENLASMMDKAQEDRAPVIITRRNKPDMVLMSLEEYEAMQETLHLTRSPRNIARLERALAEADADGLVERDLIDPAS